MENRYEGRNHNTYRNCWSVDQEQEYGKEVNVALAVTLTRFVLLVDEVHFLKYYNVFSDMFGGIVIGDCKKKGFLKIVCGMWLK